MTREEAIAILHTTEYELSNQVGSTYCRKKYDAVRFAIKALEQEPTTKIDESNFSQEQYKADLQSAYDCGKSILDKIRAEIEKIYEREGNSVDCLNALDELKEFIDKYKGKSEE